MIQYCKSCACKDPKKQATPQPGQTCTGTCAAGGVYRGDGYCDDGNNNCGCEYDGGDCCGKTRSDQDFRENTRNSGSNWQKGFFAEID